jgi:hypothetical protein
MLHNSINTVTRTKGRMEILAKIANSVRGFFRAIVAGIIEGRQRQAEYIAKNHHWY